MNTKLLNHKIISEAALGVRRTGRHALPTFLHSSLLANRVAGLDMHHGEEVLRDVDFLSFFHVEDFNFNLVNALDSAEVVFAV